MQRRSKKKKIKTHTNGNYKGWKIEEGVTYKKRSKENEKDDDNREEGNLKKRVSVHEPWVSRWNPQKKAASIIQNKVYTRDMSLLFVFSKT